MTDLRFHGFLPQSFSDYRRKIAAVLFIGGCNFRCRFCYNRGLVLRPGELPTVGAGEILAKLKEREGFIDAVVITGGEPTLSAGLIPFLRTLRSQTNLLIGLDTNGTRPDVLAQVITGNLADRLALDLKAPWEKYPAVTGRNDLTEQVKESFRLLSEAEIDYEIRLTLHRALHSEQDIYAMARILSDLGLSRIALQTFRPWHVIDPELEKQPAYSPAELQNFARFFPGQVEIR